MRGRQMIKSWKKIVMMIYKIDKQNKLRILHTDP